MFYAIEEVNYIYWLQRVNLVIYDIFAMYEICTYVSRELGVKDV